MTLLRASEACELLILETFFIECFLGWFDSSYFVYPNRLMAWSPEGILHSLDHKCLLLAVSEHKYTNWSSLSILHFHRWIWKVQKITSFEKWVQCELTILIWSRSTSLTISLTDQSMMAAPLQDDEIETLRHIPRKVWNKSSQAWTHMSRSSVLLPKTRCRPCMMLSVRCYPCPQSFSVTAMLLPRSSTSASTAVAFRPMAFMRVCQ